MNAKKKAKSDVWALVGVGGGGGVGGFMYLD